MKNDYILIYAIIPSYLYKTKELTGEEKLLAERITALCRQKGYSWISNKSLAQMYGIREDTVSRHIKKLKEVGFIKCLYGKDTNNKSARIIYLNDNIWDKWPNNDCTNNQAEVGIYQDIIINIIIIIILILIYWMKQFHMMRMVLCCGMVKDVKRYLVLWKNNTN